MAYITRWDFTCAAQPAWPGLACGTREALVCHEWASDAKQIMDRVGEEGNGRSHEAEEEDQGPGTRGQGPGYWDQGPGYWDQGQEEGDGPRHFHLAAYLPVYWSPFDVVFKDRAPSARPSYRMPPCLAEVDRIGVRSTVVGVANTCRCSPLFTLAGLLRRSSRDVSP